MRVGVSVQALYVQGVYLSEGAFLDYITLSLPVVLPYSPCCPSPQPATFLWLGFLALVFIGLTCYTTESRTLGLPPTNLKEERRTRPKTKAYFL